MSRRQRELFLSIMKADKKSIKSMYKKKLWTGLLIALFMTCSVAGCGKNAGERKQKVTIGVAIYDQYDLFLKALIDEMNEYAQKRGEELNLTISLNLENASYSQNTQNSQVKDMLREGEDVVCVNLVDRTDAGTIIDMSVDADVPIIFFNRELVENDLERSDNLYYVGAVVEQAGKIQGNCAAEWYWEHPEGDKNGDGKLQYIMLEGGQGHQDAISRTNESVRILEEQGVMLEKTGFAMANWSRDQAKTKISQMLTAGTQIELVLANNDAMALGAIDAYEEAGIPEEEWPAIFGIDGIDEALDAVAEGKMQATVLNDYKHQADAMLDLAIALAMGNDLDNLEYSPDENRCIRTEYYPETRDDMDIDSENLYSTQY